jgi:hypothetical protein
MAMKPLLWILSVLFFCWGGLGAAAWASGGAGAHPSTSANWKAEPNQTNAYFGSAVASAGDVNGDGYADVIVGAEAYDNGQIGEGWAFVFNGSAGGLGTTPDWRAESNLAGAHFGSSVASAGDVNGDGYADVIVGAYGYDSGQGRAYVYHGSATGPSTIPNWIAESNQATAYFGNSVASAGDVNGDGYADVIVGAPYYDNGQTDEGRAFVFYGSASGLGTTPDWKAESNKESGNFGYSVASAGDVNGDGYDDIIIGAAGYTHGQVAEGRAYVYHGSPEGLSTTPNWKAESHWYYANFGYSVASAGDVNGDGYDDVIVSAPFYYDDNDDYEGEAFAFLGSGGGLSSIYQWKVEPNRVRAFFGYSVASAGDMNGDGYDDVIVGADAYGEGRALVFHGSPNGLSIVPNWIAEPNQDNAEFGSSVASASDVNADGYDDVIVGAPYYDNGQTDEGRAFVYHGSAGSLNG